MAKVRFRPSNYLEFEIDGNSHVEIFKQLADFSEVFTDEPCGLCKSEDTRFIVRNVDDNNFYERKCMSCNGKLAYGQHKKGGSLFPKRTIDDEYDRVNKGWFKWVPDGEPTKKKKK